jgi:hypothetical protein
MRILAALTALAVLSTPLAPLAFGQSQAGGTQMTPLPACKGVYSITRVVELKSGVTVDQYMTALKAHAAWYKKHGYDDVIYANQVIDLPNGKYSDTSILSHHYFKATSPRPTRDAEWDAFVKMYTDASDMKESFYTCVPMAHAPRSMK